MHLLKIKNRRKFSQAAVDQIFIKMKQRINSLFVFNLTGPDIVFKKNIVKN